ncbi:MAG: electron transport complex subunit E [Candidatus Kappaea frigidicola]|nr:electron transport complex subunit E [Candidatus Kappaea frigidicola]
MQRTNILFSDFIKGLWQQNPTFRLLIGMCPTLAVTSQVQNGLAMGLATAFTLLASSIIISIFRNFIPREVRIPSYIVIIATFVTIVSLFLKANFPEVSKDLGPYVPLIIVNCLILGRQEAFASKNPVYRAIADALGMGIGFTLSLMVLASVREVLGMGTLLGHQVIFGNFRPWVIMLTPPGAFLTLGLLLGLVNIIDKAVKARKEKK